MNSWKRGWQAILLGALLLGSSWAEAAPIEMQVVEGDVRSVLLSLARTAHENIVLDDSVAGTVTLHATEEPAKLLRMIAASKGLVLVKEGSTYLVTTMPRADALRSVHVYPVRHADPADLARAAELSLRSAAGDKTADGQEAGTARRVLVDSATNSVLFYGTAAEAAGVAEVVRHLDCKPQQVSLEAKVVALSKDASKNSASSGSGHRCRNIQTSRRRTATRARTMKCRKRKSSATRRTERCRASSSSDAARRGCRSSSTTARQYRRS